MTKIELNCPYCGHQFDLMQARSDHEWHALVKLVLELPPVVHRAVWSYLTLFSTPPRKLQSAKMLRIIKELAPHIKSATVTRNKTTYAVPPDAWSTVMTSLADNPPKSLSLPLKTNGYLLEILASQAEKFATINEQKTEEAKRHGSHRQEPITDDDPWRHLKAYGCNPTTLENPNG